MKRTERRIPAGEFKARCLKLMDEVGSRRTSVTITKRGKPVARLVPADDEPPALFGFLKGSVIVKDDINQPVDVTWDADA